MAPARTNHGRRSGASRTRGPQAVPRADGTAPVPSYPLVDRCRLDSRLADSIADFPPLVSRFAVSSPFPSVAVGLPAPRPAGFLPIRPLSCVCPATADNFATLRALRPPESVPRGRLTEKRGPGRPSRSQVGAESTVSTSPSTPRRLSRCVYGRSCPVQPDKRTMMPSAPAGATARPQSNDLANVVNRRRSFSGPSAISRAGAAPGTPRSGR